MAAGGEGRRGVTPRPSPHAARGTRGSWSRAEGAGRAWPRGGCRSAAGASSPPCSSPPPSASFPRGGGGEGNPPGAAGSRRGFEVPAAAARAPRGGGAWRAARMLPGYSARSAGRCARGMVGARASVSAHAPRRPSPPGGSPPPTRGPPQSGAGLCLPRVAAAWDRWGRPAWALWSRPSNLLLAGKAPPGPVRAGPRVCSVPLRTLCFNFLWYTSALHPGKKPHSHVNPKKEMGLEPRRESPLLRRVLWRGDKG